MVATVAIQKNNAQDRVFLTGLSTPNATRPYVKDGIVKEFVLWDPVDLGYLTVHVALRLHKGELADGTYDMGRLKNIVVQGDQVILGPPLYFDRDNIDQYDF